MRDIVYILLTWAVAIGLYVIGCSIHFHFEERRYRRDLLARWDTEMARQHLLFEKEL